MKKILMIFLALIIVIVMVAGKFYYTIYASEYSCLLASESKNLTTDQYLKIGTYNVHSLNYGKADLKNFVNDVKDLQLDIICLQEVDKNAWRSENFDMVMTMAKEAGYPYYHFYSTMWLLNGYYGIGILSRYPITEVSSQLMPNSLIKEPRILTKTIIQYGKIPLTVYNSHVAYDEYRSSQLEFIENNITNDGYTLLAGDFNYFFGYNQPWQMDKLNSVNDDESLMTYGNYGCPDNIYYSNRLKLVERAVKQSTFSDHNLLYAKFMLS